MAMTVSDILRRLEGHRYALAVWSNIESHLCSLLDMDQHRTAENALQVTGCSEAYVPQDVVQEIIERIRDEEIKPLTRKIEAAEAMTVEDEDGDEEEEDIPKAHSGDGKKGAKSEKLGTIRTTTRRRRAETG